MCLYVCVCMIFCVPEITSNEYTNILDTDFQLGHCFCPDNESNTVRMLSKLDTFLFSSESPLVMTMFGNMPQHKPAYLGHSEELQLFLHPALCESRRAISVAEERQLVCPLITLY